MHTQPDKQQEFPHLFAEYKTYLLEKFQNEGDDGLSVIEINLGGEYK